MFKRFRCQHLWRLTLRLSGNNYTCIKCGKTKKVNVLYIKDWTIKQNLKGNRIEVSTLSNGKEINPNELPPK